MFKVINSFIDTLINSLGTYGPILGCFLITIESIFPILPLFVFITINFITFGHIIGFILSWFFTCLGCSLSFFIFRKNIKTHFYKYIKKRGIISKETIDIISNLKVEQLSVIIAMPFTPAFLVNIAAGISNMPFKKFLVSLLIGKIFLVYFCGYIGCSLLESFKHPVVFLKVGIMLLIAYLISRIVNKKFSIN